jgi:large subunit ribosomal protein L24
VEQESLDLLQEIRDKKFTKIISLANRSSMKKKVSRSCKIGDKVKVISGNQKGLSGYCLFGYKKSVVILDGITPRIKFVKNPQGKMRKNRNSDSIHTSNVMLWDKRSKSCSKIGYKIVNDKKVRYFKKVWKYYSVTVWTSSL